MSTPVFAQQVTSPPGTNYVVLSWQMLPEASPGFYVVVPKLNGVALAPITTDQKSGPRWTNYATDADWIAANFRAMFRMYDLALGTYTFDIYALGADGTKGATIMSLAVTVVTPAAPPKDPIMARFDYIDAQLAKIETSVAGVSGPRPLGAAVSVQMPAQVPVGYSSSRPDNVAKAPLPDMNANKAMIAAVNARLDQAFPAGKAPTSQYPSAAKLVDAFVYEGATVDKIDAYYRSCFGTGAYGPMGTVAQNGLAREKAFTVGHDNLTDQLITYVSYKTAPLPTKAQLV